MALFFVAVVVFEVVASMMSVGELGMWSNDVGIFRKALWWLEKCCSIVVRV